jgi:hypothetical protein
VCFKRNRTIPSNPNRQTIDLWPDFAEIIGVGRNSVYAGARRGDFRTIRIGKKIVVSMFEVERLLAGGAVMPGTTATSQTHIDVVSPEAPNSVRRLTDDGPMRTSDKKSAEAV